MKKLQLIVSLAIGFHPCDANDGSFYARGNTLVPLQETTIENDPAILSREEKELLEAILKEERSR